MLTYDLDYMAAGFRLQLPHEEFHRMARETANAMLTPFLDYVRENNIDCFIIRMAPAMWELDKIQPDKILMFHTQHGTARVSNIRFAKSKLANIKTWAEQNHVNVQDMS